MTKNTGGRRIFDCGDVRIFQLDGLISSKVYIIRPDTNRSDGSGHLEILDKETGKVIKIHHRRIIPKESYGCAVAFEHNDKFYAKCPKCHELLTLFEKSDLIKDVDTLECPRDGCFVLYWIGERPMAEVEKKEKKIKEIKPVKEPIKVDLKELASIEHCELWSKAVKFDHPGVDVMAHVLLHTDEDSRKLCFNSYGEHSPGIVVLGKKSKELALDNFKSGQIGGSVFTVKDLVKERTKLVAGGYEQMKE